MPIPIPYFKNVPSFGNLEMDRIIVDYDYPLFFVLKDAPGGRYLCMCFDTRGAQQWLLTPVSIACLISVLENKTELAVPFEDTRSKKVLAAMDYRTRAETFRPLDARSVPKEILPEAGEYLDAEPGEWDDYIKELERPQLLATVPVREVYRNYAYLPEDRCM